MVDAHFVRTSALGAINDVVHSGVTTVNLVASSSPSNSTEEVCEMTIRFWANKVSAASAREPQTKMQKPSMWTHRRWWCCDDPHSLTWRWPSMIEPLPSKRRERIAGELARQSGVFPCTSISAASIPFSRSVEANSTSSATAARWSGDWPEITPRADR